MSIRSRISTAYSAFDYSSTKQSINFAYGLPDPEMFGKLRWPEAISTHTGVSFSDLLQYTDGSGLPQLREKLAHQHAVACDNVLITNGASQALQLIADAVLDPGDVVLTEDPSYLGALRIFSIAGATMVQLGMDKDGVDLGQLEEALRTTGRVRLFYTAPVFHNPTGRRFSVHRMGQVAALLARYGVLMVQDLVYADLPYDDPPPAIIASGEHVINVYSISKIAGPGLRVGWVVAEAQMIAQLTRLKCDGGVSPVASNVALALLGTPELKAHIAGLRQHYRHKRDSMHALLQSCTFCEPSYEVPLGGFSFWVRLAGAVAPAALLESVRKKYDVHLVEGYRHGPTSRQHVRLCFSYMPMEKVQSGLRDIEAAYKGLL
ncbi:2-aminoadipate transaminase [Mesorhizobium robiniae]|uniref:2-aminoadipate transaminase n=1 Tax=Mesorhizobium robiniae TaxID=559315 RepID=A0ABV2GZE0_9HYPH|nr:PLP-dependent aminotransferase family protein [Mesorhizobium sp. ZC-5]MCV3243621.1 PLP-dependent aminotransferase family protein [Mesorhizobium sp. ZC-5]